MDNPDPMAWPKRDDITRINNYEHYDRLYFGEHYKAFAIKANKGFPENYQMLRYVVANFAGLISKVMADMLFGERIVIDVKDKNTQGFLDGIIDDNHLITQLYESSLANSRRGDSIFKMRLGAAEEEGESKIIIEELPPSIYFPEMDVSSPRFTPDKDVLAWTFSKNRKTYLQKEIHTPGLIENALYEYNPETKRIISRLTDDELKAFNIEPSTDTGIKRSLIFHIPNFRDGNGFWGTSDYRDLEQLMFALNNRITKIDNILDKHSDPILAVPPGVLDEDGKVRKERLGMFEVDNENSGFNKPEYIVWNANLESAFKEIDSLLDMLFMFSEIAPATMDRDSGGGKAESGRALKFKLLRTIAKRNRKILYYDIMIKEMLETAQEFATAHNVSVDNFSPGKEVETPEIKWGEGIIPDIIEMIDAEVARIDAGISSRADAIANLDGLKPEDAKTKVIEIDKEGAITMPASVDPTLPGKTQTPPGTPPAQAVPAPTPAKFPTPPSNRI